MSRNTGNIPNASGGTEITIGIIGIAKTMAMPTATITTMGMMRDVTMRIAINMGADKIMTKHPPMKLLLIAGLITLVIVLGYNILNAPDRRDPGQKISDAINELPNGVDKATRQLKDRTPGEKLKDAAKDEGDDIKKATNQQ